MAAVTNYHELSGLKQHTFIILQFWSSDVCSSDLMLVPFPAVRVQILCKSKCLKRPAGNGNEARAAGCQHSCRVCGLRGGLPWGGGSCLSGSWSAALSKAGGHSFTSAPADFPQAKRGPSDTISQFSKIFTCNLSLSKWD